MMLKCFLFLLLMFSLPAVGRATQHKQSQQEEWWLNLANAPLKITKTANKRHTLLTNNSTKLVHQVQLGCIKINKETKEVQVINEFEPQKVELQPPDETGKVSFITFELLEQGGKICQEKQTSHLAVIKVWFADGSIWQITCASVH